MCRAEPKPADYHPARRDLDSSGPEVSPGVIERVFSLDVLVAEGSGVLLHNLVPDNDLVPLGALIGLVCAGAVILCLEVEIDDFCVPVVEGSEICLDVKLELCEVDNPLGVCLSPPLNTLDACYTDRSTSFWSVDEVGGYDRGYREYKEYPCCMGPNGT